MIKKNRKTIIELQKPERVKTKYKDLNLNVLGPVSESVLANLSWIVVALRIPLSR
jgi:hypothetical protein